MTPSLFDLPVRAPEAAELARLVLEEAGSKPLEDELRQRIAGRAGLLKLESITAHFGSLERDPIHAGALYLAIDGLEAQPLLLRMAPATTPGSGLFPNATLIGRMPGPKGVEMVLSASPYDEVARTFAEKVNRAFLPRPHGGRSAILVRTRAPRTVLPAAFDAFRAILRTRGSNFAGVENAQDGVWAAIRSGWREGYTAEAKNAVPADSVRTRQRAVCWLTIEDAAEASQLLEKCSQFLL